MDYEKLHKDTINKLQQMVNSGKITVKTARGICADFIPESEDEKIRKALISFLKSPFVNENITDEKVTPWISWLEKQGEQKSIDVRTTGYWHVEDIEQKLVQEIEPTPIFRIGDTLKRKGKDYTFRVDRIQGGYYHCDCNHGAFFPIEEQGNWELVEQNPADKVEPKFKVGDWITIKEGIWKI